MSEYLKNVPEDRAFFLGEKKLMNLQELYEAVKSIDNDNFRNYVGENYNHFANWVNEIVKDSILAASLRNATTKEETEKILHSRISSLKSADEAAKIKQVKNEEENTHHFTPHHEHIHKEALLIEKKEPEEMPKKEEESANAKKNEEPKAETGIKKEEHHTEEHHLHHEHDHHSHEEAQHSKHNANDNQQIEEFLRHHHIKFMGKETATVFFVGIFIGIVVGLIIARMALLR